MVAYSGRRAVLEGRVILTCLVVLGSTSELKYAAVVSAIEQVGIDAQVIAVKTVSGVGEQPVEGETLVGACNRANYAALAVPDALFSVAIENGVFKRGGDYVDIAIVVARLQTGKYIQVESEEVVFPYDAVEETIRREQANGRLARFCKNGGIFVGMKIPILILLLVRVCVFSVMRLYIFFRGFVISIRVSWRARSSRRERYGV